MNKISQKKCQRKCRQAVAQYNRLKNNQSVAKPVIITNIIITNDNSIPELPLGKEVFDNGGISAVNPRI